MEQNVMTVKTRYGTVDETALQAFLDDFDTGSILQVVSNCRRLQTETVMLAISDDFCSQ